MKVVFFFFFWEIWEERFVGIMTDSKNVESCTGRFVWEGLHLAVNRSGPAELCRFGGFENTWTRTKMSMYCKVRMYCHVLLNWGSNAMYCKPADPSNAWGSEEEWALCAVILQKIDLGVGLCRRRLYPRTSS